MYIDRIPMHYRITLIAYRYVYTILFPIVHYLIISPPEIHGYDYITLAEETVSYLHNN